MHRSFEGPSAMMPGMATISRQGVTDTVRAMGDSEVRAERIEALRGLLGRLCAPDLTLAGAKQLRTRLIDLLEQIDQESAPLRDIPSQPLAPSSDRSEVP